MGLKHMKKGDGILAYGTDERMGNEHLQNARKPPTPEQIRRAQRVVASMALSPEDAKMLLQMAGIDERIE